MSGHNISVRRSARHLLSGTIVSQAVQFAASLLLTRLFSPAEFGQFASALGVASLLSVVIVLSYPTAIPLAETDEQARILTWVSVAFAMMLSLPVLLVLGGLAWQARSVFGTPIHWWYALFVPLGASLIAIFSALQLRLSRLGEFRQIGRATAFGAMAQATSQVALGYAGLGAAGLALGYLLGRALNVLILVTKSRVGRPPGGRSLTSAARSWSGRTRWLLLTTIMNMLGTSAMTPWVQRQYGSEVAGSFALAFQTLSVPAALFGQAIGTIMFPKLAAAKRDGVLNSKQVAGYVTGLASVAFPVFLPILILGPTLYTIVFGDEWRMAGVIAAILAPWLMVSFVSSPISSLVLVQGKFQHATAIAVGEAFLRLAAIGVGGAMGSATAGFGLYMAVGVTLNGGYVVWMMRLAGGSLGSVVRAEWKGCCAGGVAAVTLLAMRPFVSFQVLAALTVATSGVALWGAAHRVRGDVASTRSR